jgi:hypothetical protein
MALSSVGFFNKDGEVDLKALRARLRKMDDEELRRYGRAAKSMCSPEANLGKPPRQTFVIQLQEARAEWDRRKAVSGRS